MKLPPSIDYFLASALSSKTEGTRIAVFDCDGTIIKGDIGEAMFYHQIDHFLFRESPAQLWPDHPRNEELRHLYESLVHFPPYVRNQDGRHISFANLLLSWYFDQLAEGKTSKACSDIVRLCSGFKPSELEQIATDTVRAERAAPMGERLVGRYPVPTGIRYLGETIELIRRTKAAGFDIWVVSGSNAWSVREVCRSLDIPFGRIIGIDLDIRGELFTDGIVEPVPVREGKVEALSLRGLPPPDLVISDSVYDRPLFDHCSGLKIFIESNESAESFFRAAKTTPDERWAVINRPSYLP